MRERTILQQNFDAFMKNWDVLIVPSGTQTLQITNLTGHPCVVLPNGFNQDKTPTSICFIGQLFGEAKILAAGEQSRIVDMQLNRGS